MVQWVPGSGPVDVDMARYQHTAGRIATQAEDAVGRAVGGGAWLRRRFTGRSFVEIRLKSTGGDGLEIGPPRTEEVYDDGGA
jgi:hypothetical protein